MSNYTINSLPSEIIVRILEDKQLGFSDVINLSFTCKNLHKIIDNDNELWKRKFFQRWPILEEIYRTNKPKGCIVNWKEEIEISLNIRKKLLYQLSLMSSKHYRQGELPNSAFKVFDPLFRVEDGAHPFAYYFLVDELISLIKAPALTNNLTHRYYALKVVEYLKQNHLKKEWQKFISLPPSEQTLEKGATIVAQWGQPERHVTYSYILSLLDTIAEQTKALLKERYPAHSIFSTSPEQFAFWKNNIIDDNQWSVPETKQITDALCKVLFYKFGFYGSNEMYYSSENSFLDRVLEHTRGIPITLAIVFESVARRLGVRCEPVIFPSHFLLRWKETYGPDSENVENFYIDVFNDGEFITKDNCPRISGVSKCPIEKYNVHRPATAVEVVRRMASNLEIGVRQQTHMNWRISRLRSTLELRHMVQPNDPDPILKLGSLYVEQNIDLTELTDMLRTLQMDSKSSDCWQARVIFYELERRQNELLPVEEVAPKKRGPDVLYAIGMIMKHKIHQFLCVITGWDPISTATSSTIVMAIRELKKGEKQPFYEVLADDGSYQYIAQENLVVAVEPEWINNRLIGKYFYKFNGMYYLPNEEKAKEYPEDEEARNRYLQKLFNKGYLRTETCT
ncbi:F-box only protein 21 isoform X2 [Nomia melanderi]|uniref:F-box only protein 21 isoform X2 n=1 Tax=Nomia melanderi TaxID=2448451 RepID=UPI0013040D24|nr:F-box only protein 21-like isoform X2 [Nomia melanderi]